MADRPFPLRRQYSSKHFRVAHRILEGIKTQYRGDVAIIIGINYYKKAVITYMLNDATFDVPYGTITMPSEEVVAHHVPNVLVVSIVNRECTSACAMSDGENIIDRRLYNVKDCKLT